MNFDTAVDAVLKREGGYVNHKNDRGGATNHGIIQANYTQWLTKHGEPWADVKGLDADTASQIYREDYWLPAKCELLPAAIREIHFDSAVNHGVSRAAKLLQEAAEAEPDGVIGGKTLALIGEMNVRLLKARYMNERYRFYGKIIARDKSQLIFIAGWMNRMREFSI